VAGPAVQVLAAQHDELIAMLKSLDRLGAVGTRVIGRSKHDILASLAHLQPILQRLRSAGRSLAPGLNLLISFPFPKEASEIVKGDYANTSIRADINLQNFLPNGHSGGGLPPLLNPQHTLSLVTKCLRSRSMTSTPCKKVLRSAQLVKKLRRECKRPKYDGNPVCTVIEALPGGGGGGGGGGQVPGLPGGLGGALGASVLSDALTSGRPTRASSPAALYGGTS
jgi:phospholipid/cholesterol/gamma-HCH transport system substrate-binding protein